MRNLNDLTREELAAVVGRVRDALYLDEDTGTYDRDKPWGSDTLEAVARPILDAGLAPDEADAVLGLALDLLERAYHEAVPHDAGCPHRHGGECLCLRGEVARFLADSGRDP